MFCFKYIKYTMKCVKCVNVTFYMRDNRETCVALCRDKFDHVTICLSLMCTCK